MFCKRFSGPEWVVAPPVAGADARQVNHLRFFDRQHFPRESALDQESPGPRQQPGITWTTPNPPAIESAAARISFDAFWSCHSANGFTR